MGVRQRSQVSKRRGDPTEVYWYKEKPFLENVFLNDYSKAKQDKISTLLCLFLIIQNSLK